MAPHRGWFPKEMQNGAELRKILLRNLLYWLHNGKAVASIGIAFTEAGVVRIRNPFTLEVIHVI